MLLRAVASDAAKGSHIMALGRPTAVPAGSQLHTANKEQPHAQQHPSKEGLSLNPGEKTPDGKGRRAAGKLKAKGGLPLSSLGGSSLLLADLSSQKLLSPASFPQHQQGSSRQSLEVTPRTNTNGT